MTWTDRLLAIVNKEIKQLVRDKKTLALVILLPLFLTLLFGISYAREPVNVPTGIVVGDSRYAAKVVLNRLLSDRTFNIKYFLSDLKTAKFYVEKSKIMLAVVIPEGFTEMVEETHKAYIVTIIDTARRISLPEILMAKFEKIVLDCEDEVSKELYMRKRVVAKVNIENVVDLVGGEPSMVDLVTPVVLGIMTQQVPLTLASISIVRERERGTLEKLLTTPIGRIDLIIGKLIPFLFVGVAISLGSLFLLIMIGATFKGSYIDIVIVSFALGLASLGVGLFFSVLSTNQLQAMQFSTFFLIASFLFSGFVFAPEAMRPELRPIVYTMPLYYYFECTSNIILKGLSLSVSICYLIYLFVYAFIILAFSFKFMSRKLE